MTKKQITEHTNENRGFNVTFLSPRQLALRWDCSPTSAQRIAKKAGIARYCLGDGKNGMVRYRLTEIQAYEEQRRIGYAE